MPAIAERSAPQREQVVAERGGTKLNIGCGPIQPEGWVNVDGSNRAWLASKLPWLDRALTSIGLISPTEFTRETACYDIRRGLRESDGSVSCIYCGELLEHLTRDEGERFLRECFRVLEPGGVLRLRVPDNYEFWRQYVAEFEQQRCQANGSTSGEIPHARWVEMFFRDICVRRPWLGSMGHFHKWMYDELSLGSVLSGVGFVEVERRRLHESRISDIAAVENRFDLIMECVKPVWVKGPAEV